jgi:hypothetical protein
MLKEPIQIGWALFCFDLNHAGDTGDSFVASRRFRFGRWHIADRLEKAPVVEPVDPFPSCIFHFVGFAPRTALPNQPSLVNADDRFRQGVVVKDTPDDSARWPKSRA